MTSYRLLWFDHAQHIILSKHVECRTDQAAIHLADRQVGDYERLEDKLRNATTSAAKSVSFAGESVNDYSFMLD